jgi:flagellar basal-body rod protein FlgG
MNGAFYIGATGLDAQERALDVVANNIANINTTAFKRSSPQFSQLVGAAPDPLDPTSSQAVRGGRGLGVAVDTSPIDFTEGPLNQTGQATDLAISGTGFIELLGAGGQTQLWRGGSLEVNSDGYLAAANGTALKARISVPTGSTNLTIDQDGTVHATLPSGAVKTLGAIEIVQAKDPSSISALSGGLYQVANDQDLVSSAPGEDGAGCLVQGALETSNVNLSNEMVTILLLQRAFSANSQVVQAGDQLMTIANSLRR